MEHRVEDIGSPPGSPPQKAGNRGRKLGPAGTAGLRFLGGLSGRLLFSLPTGPHGEGSGYQFQSRLMLVQEVPQLSAIDDLLLNQPLGQGLQGFPVRRRMDRTSSVALSMIF